MISIASVFTAVSPNKIIAFMNPGPCLSCSLSSPNIQQNAWYLIRVYQIPVVWMDGWMVAWIRLEKDGIFKLAGM